MSDCKLLALNESDIETILYALDSYKDGCEGFSLRLEEIEKLEMYLKSKIEIEGKK